MGLSPAQLPVGVQQQPSSEPVRAPAPAPVPAPLPAAVATAVQAPPSPPPPPPSPPSQPLPPPPAPPVIVFPWQASVPAVAPATADNPFYLQVRLGAACELQADVHLVAMVSMMGSQRVHLGL